MNLNNLIFIILNLSNVISFPLKTTSSRDLLDEHCSDRWQLIDELNLRITFDWQIKRSNDEILIEFRSNLLAKGFWHGFAISSSPSNQSVCHFIND